MVLDVLFEIAGLWVQQGDGQRTATILRFLGQQSQLSRQRHQRVAELLARLDGREQPGAAGVLQDGAASPEQIVILAITADPLPV